MKGRKPLPNQLKRVLGDGVHDSGGRLIGNEPQPQPGVPDCPRTLKGPEKKAWQMFAQELESMGVATKADRAALVMLSQCWSQLEELAQAIRAEGTIITLPNGIKTQNAALKTYREVAKFTLSLLAEFGLTPSSRSRIQLPLSPDADDEDLVDALD